MASRICLITHTIFTTLKQKQDLPFDLTLTLLLDKKKKPPHAFFSSLIPIFESLMQTILAGYVEHDRVYVKTLSARLTSLCFC